MFPWNKLPFSAKLFLLLRLQKKKNNQSERFLPSFPQKIPHQATIAQIVMQEIQRIAPEATWAKTFQGTTDEAVQADGSSWAFER